MYCVPCSPDSLLARAEPCTSAGRNDEQLPVQVALTLQAPDEQPREVQLSRRRINTDPVKSRSGPPSAVRGCARCMNARADRWADGRGHQAAAM